MIFNLRFIVSVILSLIAWMAVIAQPASRLGVATQPAATTAASAPATTAPVVVNTRTTTNLPPPSSPGSKQLVKLLGPTITDTPWTGWLILLFAIAGGLAASKVIQTIMRDLARRMEQRGWHARAEMFLYAAGPAGLALFNLGLGIGLQALVIEPELNDLVNKVQELLYIIAIAWFLFNLVDLLDLALRRLAPKGAAAKIDDTVIMLLRKTMRVFLLILFVLFIAQNIFQQNITTWLAGLGIAGLAVSLAAQDSVKNFFGSVTVLIERPFSLGDRIIFGTYDGTVETIGFRSTKIRTIAGNLVTLPNMKFTDGVVENLSTRPWVRRTMNLTIACDTPPAKIEEALAIIKRILAEPEIFGELDHKSNPPQVFFNEFNADSFNLIVNYWYASESAAAHRKSFAELAEAINLKVCQSFERAGIEFAFPTRTVFLANDPKRRLSILMQAGDGQRT